MIEDITEIDMQVIGFFIPDYMARLPIRGITERLGINYSHAFRRIKELVKRDVLSEKRAGKANIISFNTESIEAIRLLSYVEETKSVKFRNSSLGLLIKEFTDIDPFCCIGVFGSRVSGKHEKDSDWDVFVICQENRKSGLQKVMSRFSHVDEIQVQFIGLKEFRKSLISSEETVVKHIIRNKHIIFNPHPFYNMLRGLEKIKYAPKG